MFYAIANVLPTGQQSFDPPGDNFGNRRRVANALLVAVENNIYIPTNTVRFTWLSFGNGTGSDFKRRFTNRGFSGLILHNAYLDPDKNRLKDLARQGQARIIHRNKETSPQVYWSKLLASTDCDWIMLYDEETAVPGRIVLSEEWLKTIPDYKLCQRPGEKWAMYIRTVPQSIKERKEALSHA